MTTSILVVDDDDAVRTIAVETLKDAGYRVLEAAQAADAIQLLEESPPVTLLFTDIDMPGVNGYVLADMAVTRWPHLRVLYTTGALKAYAGAQPGLLHGEMLTRPYRAAQLIATVARSVLQWRPSRRDLQMSIEPESTSAQPDARERTHLHGTGIPTVQWSSPSVRNVA